MRTILIKTISLINFKGQTRKVDFNSKDISIIGRNEEGKSSIFNAWKWLLRGVTDANYGSNHELFNNKIPIDENTPTVEVESLIDIDGIEYRIKRTAKAKFTKVKGSDVLEKAKSDEYRIYVDDVEYNQTMFNKWIENNICDPDKFIYCIDGHFFLNLSLEDRDKAIKIIHSIVGEITNGDFEGDFSTLFKMLERYDIDQLKEETKSRKKPINERLKVLPDLIKAIRLKISELKYIDNSELLSELNKKKSQYNDIEQKILDASKIISPLIEKRSKELQDIDYAERELNNKAFLFNSSEENKINSIIEKISTIDKENFNIENENKKIKFEYERSKSRLKNLKEELSESQKNIELLRERKNLLKQKVFSPDLCPYCEQDLPLEYQVTAIQKYNSEREAELKIVNSNGVSLKKKIERLEKEISDLELELQKEPELKPFVSKIDLEEQLDKAKKEKVSFESTDEYKSEKERIEKLKESLTVVSNIDLSNETEKKNILLGEIEAINQKLGKISQLENLNSELEKLLSEQKEQASSLAKIERLELQIKEYEREKAIIASKRVNNLLDYCNIQTQVMQKDGNYKDSCTITRKDGVKYVTANGGSRILMALDIQRMFCKHCNINTPLWIDECAVLDSNKIPKFEKTQVICIFRDDCDFKIENR